MEQGEGKEPKPPKQQVNVRLEEATYERLRAWSFLERGDGQVGPFMADVMVQVIDAAAEENPEIDRLVELSAQRRESAP